MPVTFQATTNGSGLGTASVTKPASTAAGDVLIAEASQGGSAAFTATPTGFTVISDAVQGSLRKWCGYRVVDGTEGASFTWTNAASARIVASVTRATGVNNATPLDVTSTTYAAASGNIVLPTLTTSVVGCGLYATGGQFSTNTFSPPTAPVTFTEFSDLALATVCGTSAGVVWTGSGATGAVTITPSTGTADVAGVLVALRPAAGPPVTGSASWAGAGAMTSTGIVGKRGAAAFAAQGDMTSAAYVRQKAQALLSGQGAMSAAAYVRQKASASWSGQGVTAFAATVQQMASALWSGTGAVIVTGILGRRGVASWSGTGTWSAAGIRAPQGSALWTGVGTMSPTAYVRQKASASWSAMGTMVPPPVITVALYDDYTCKSGVNYAYRVKVYGVNDTFVWSEWTE